MCLKLVPAYYHMGGWCSAENLGYYEVNTGLLDPRYNRLAAEHLNYAVLE